MLMGSLRYEGDSRFGAGHKWGYFPAVPAGWRLSDEPFMENFPLHFNDLKLRFGYGVTGIAPGGSYNSLTSYRYGSRFLYNGAWVQGLSPNRNPNPNLKWEGRGDQRRPRLRHHRLAPERQRRRVPARHEGHAVQLQRPGAALPVREHAGQRRHMRNKGIEAELSYEVVRRPGLNWTTSANWSTNRNKLVSLSDDVKGQAPATASCDRRHRRADPAQQHR